MQNIRKNKKESERDEQMASKEDKENDKEENVSLGICFVFPVRM